MAEETSLFRHSASSEPGRARLEVRCAERSPHPVSPLLYGKFCEHLGSNIYNGMEAQILRNPTFGAWRFSAPGGHPDGGIQGEYDFEKIAHSVKARAEGRLGFPSAEPLLEAYREGGAYGWWRLGPKDALRLSPDAGPHGGRAQRVELLEASAGEPRGIAQWIHLPLHRTREYAYRVVARAAAPCVLELSLAPLVNGASGAPLARVSLPVGTEWSTLQGGLELPAEAEARAGGLFQLNVAFSAPGNVVLDRVLLYPGDHVGGADPDVIRLLKEARLPLLRWPGGNFVSGYHWLDGVGPVDARPTRPNPAWDGLEYNFFGTDEFIAFCRAVGCEPLICVNAGNGTPEEAAAWVEYCNGAPESAMGRKRAENGHPEPFQVKYWEIGNELYGRWQVNGTTPGGYADRYARFRQALLEADPTIRLIANGAPCGDEPSEWNRKLIHETDRSLRSLSDHILTGGAVDAGTDPGELFHAFLGYAGVVGRRYRKLEKEMREAGLDEPHVAITELQLFAHFRGEAKPGGTLTPGTMPRQDSIAEALYFSTIAHECIRLGAFVELITHSATVNHGGGLRKARERVWANPVHHAHALGAALWSGVPVGVELACGTYATGRAFGSIPPLADVPLLDAMAVLVGGGQKLVLMLVHRGASHGPLELSVKLGDFSAAPEAEVITLAGETLHDGNRLEEPERIAPRRSSLSVEDHGRQAKLTLPPFSLTRLTFRKA